MVMHLQLSATLRFNFVHYALELVSAFICVYLIRAIYRQVFVRIALRHVPGPNRSDFIWGEEWRLYHTEPGSLYVDWHKEFGQVVKFTGAFGVSIIPIAVIYLRTWDA